MSRLIDYLIAHYKMNDNAGDAVVVDSSGNGHTGEYQLNSIAQNTNTSDELGKINRALDFVGGTGTGEHIEIANHADFTPAGTPFSISMWVNMHTARYFIWASKWQDGVNQEWNIFTGTGKTIHFRVYDQSANAYIGRAFGTSLAFYEGKWTHFVATYDGGKLSVGCKIYLNGNRVDDTDSKNINYQDFESVENHSQPVWIGRYSTHYSNGLIDNVIFFNKELTLLEAKYLYNNGHGTEILAEVDEPRLLLRRNNSQFGLRSR